MKETVTNNISVVKESVMVIQLNVTSTEMAKVQDLVLKNVLKCVFLYGIKFPLGPDSTGPNGTGPDGAGLNGAGLNGTGLDGTRLDGTPVVVSTAGASKF